MSVQTKLPFDRETVTRFSKEKNEPEWMRRFRLEALAQWEELPLPKLEKTKLTRWNVDDFLPFEEAKSVSALPESVRDLVDDEQQNVVVQKNSSVVFERVSDELKEQGVIFTSMENALREHETLVKKTFMTDNVKADEHKLTALHAALWSGGVFVYVPKNTEVSVPLQACYYASGERAGLLPHVIIVAEDNSSVTYMDSYTSDSSATTAVQNSVVEVYAGPGAKVRFASVRGMDENRTDYVFRRAKVEKDATVEWSISEMSDGNIVSDNSTDLLGHGSRVETKTASIGTGEQKENVTSYVRHVGQNTTSNLLSRGVMKGSATAIFNGITKIESGAEKAKGEQAENILMLSEKSRGDANPILLIDEDDVEAGHAASVGKVNDIQLYYLMSRGISQKEAERLIIHGFIHPVIADIPSKSLKAYMEKQIERKINQ